MADKSIQAVLFELGLGTISQRFIEHKINFDLAKKLSDEELSALGVGTIGDRIRLKEKLNSQNTELPVAHSSPQASGSTSACPVADPYLLYTYMYERWGGGTFLSSLQLLLQKAQHRDSDPAAALAYFLKALYFRRVNMIHNEHIDLTTTEPDPPNIHRSLGVDKLKLFAGIHIGIGVACMIACTVGLITNMNRKDACCYDNSCDDDYNYSYDSDYSPNWKCRGHRTIMILYVTCLCLSLLYLLTGMIPLCMTDSRKQRWKCLKITFLVFNIISAVVFSPAMLSIGLLSIFIITLENNGDIITVSAIIDACAVIEMIVAITSATYCCCCSQMLPGNQQHVVIFNPVQERVVHTVTQLQGQPVNQYGILMPQGYPQQNSMPNTQVQIVTQQSPSQVLSPLMQGQQIQHHNGLANVNLNQQPPYLQPKLGQQPNQGVESQQQI